MQKSNKLINQFFCNDAIRNNYIIESHHASMYYLCIPSRCYTR